MCIYLVSISIYLGLTRILGGGSGSGSNVNTKAVQVGKGLEPSQVGNPPPICISTFMLIYICLSICLSVYLSVCLSIYLSIYLCIYVSIYLSNLSVYLSIFPSVHIYIYIYVRIYLGGSGSNVNTKAAQVCKKESRFREIQSLEK